MRILSTGLVIFALSGVPVMVACDRTVSHTESTESSSDGTVKKTDSTVKQDANGNVTQTDNKTETKPGAPQ